jgi:CrcB protein
MTRFLLVCAGGAAGTAARYLTALWAGAAFGPAFPFGTLIVNVAGSFLIAFIMHVGITTEWISTDVRLMLATGVVGGFTTYSTFNYETIRLFQTGALALGALNIAATVGVCLLAGGAGVLICRAIG